MEQVVAVYVVTVNYINGVNSYKDYDFLTNIPLQSEDVVVVHAATGLGLARVVGVKQLTTNTKARAWVVQKVDLTEHQERLKREKRRVELEKKLEQRFKKAEKMALYGQLAETDPLMKQYLEEYKTLETSKFAWETLPEGK